MKFIVKIPIDQVHPHGEFQNGAAASQLARAVEQAGIDAVCLAEHPAPSAEWLHNDPTGHDCLDPFTALAFAAAATDRVRLFTNVIVLPFRNPFLTAKSAATLQVLSDGRLILGVGLGYQKAEFDALGVDYKRRGALADEALEVIRLAWAGGPVVKQGHVFSFNASGNEPRPVPSPQPPIWVGGGSDMAVARAARWGDGWAPFFSVPTNDPMVMKSAVVSLDHFSEKLSRLHEERARLGRGGPFEVAVGAPFRPKALDDDTTQRFVEEAKALEARGVDWMWTPLPSPSRQAYLDALDWFGKEIVPHFTQVAA